MPKRSRRKPEVSVESISPVVWFTIMLAWILFIMILITAAGCAEPMESVSEITKLRMMAIQADPPEIRPGEGTTLRALYADPEGKGREISFLWLTCPSALTPSSEITADVCNPPLGLGMGTSGNGGDVHTVPPVAEDILDDLKEDEQYKTATTIVSMCAGGELPDLSTFDEDSDITEILDNVCKGGEGVIAFKTFRISTADDSNRNTNPELTDVYFDGKHLTEIDDEADNSTSPGVIFECKTTSACLEGAEIEAEMTESSFQTYDKIEFDDIVTGDEAPYISWFTTGGELGDTHSRTVAPPGPFKNTWSPPLDGGNFILWVVAHDLRGGTSWKKFAIGAETNLTH